MFAGLKRWELITLLVAAAAAVVLRILEESGVLSVPRVPAIVCLMVFVAVFFLRRPAAIALEYASKSNVKRTQNMIINGL